MKNIYLCSYSTGQYDDYREHNVFVTEDVEKAKNWAIKLNDLAARVKDHIEYMSKKGFYNWKSTTYNFYYFNCAVYDEIESR